MTTEELYAVFRTSSGISTDTRTIQGEELFFALRGEQYDGNAFVREALERGCRGVVADDPSIAKMPGFYLVPDALKALQDLAAYHRKVWGGKVLAITGSNGKTTTRELIAAVLSHRYKVLATEGNLNNHIGVPLTLLKIRDEDLAVIEMGANHAGEIAMLAEIAAPDEGIITNIGKAHLEGFRTVDGVMQAKGELFDYLAAHEGRAIVNMSDPILKGMVEQRRLAHFSYGTGGVFDVTGQFEGAESNIVGSFSMGEKEYILRSALFGRYNFMNMLTAAAAGVCLGVSPGNICLAVAGYQPENNRSQVVTGKSNTLILDAYNANPTSMQAALEEFIGREHDRKMVILGDMYELGDSAVAEHEAILQQLSGSSVDEVLLVGERFSHFAADPAFPFHFFVSLEDCMDYLAGMKPQNFLVLLKGSRKNRLEMTTNFLLEC